MTNSPYRKFITRIKHLLYYIEVYIGMIEKVYYIEAQKIEAKGVNIIIPYMQYVAIYVNVNIIIYFKSSVLVILHISQLQSK